jgi:phasin
MEIDAMDDTSATAKVQAAAALPLISLFELSKLELPAAFRSVAEKSAAQAKDACEKARAAAESASDLIEETYAVAAKGAVDYNLKVFAAARANVYAAFDFTNEIVSVRSLAEAVELGTAHVRTRFAAMTEQTRELASAAHKLGTDTAQPIKTGIAKAFGNSQK